MKNELFTILESSCSHGQVVTDGSLGYESIPNIVTARHQLHGYSMISAHAPSVVKIELHKPVVLSGLLNCSALLDRSNVLEYLVDWNYVGHAMNPGDETPVIYLSPGIHELRVINNGTNIHNRHSVWLLKETDMSEDNPLCVLSPMFFSLDECPRVSGVFCSSARKQNIWIDFFGMGQDFPGFTVAKIILAIEQIKSKFNRYEYFMMCDCCDVFFTNHLDNILHSFLDMNSDIVIGAEVQSHRIHTNDWINSFEKKEKGRNFINAGIWIGKKKPLLQALEKMQSVYTDIIDNNYKKEYGTTEDIDGIWRNRMWATDDQILWQLLYKTKKFDIKLDDECKIISNCNGEGPEDRIQSGLSSIFHFPGYQDTHLTHKYAGITNAYF